MRANKTYRSAKKPPPPQTEKQIHKSLCNYIRITWPDVIFFSDMSGLKTSIGVAMQMKSLRSGRGIPDLFIAAPRSGYNGCFIEIKKSREEVFKKNGTLRMNEHVVEQAMNLDKLKNLGYFAVFGCGLTDCMEIVTEYLEK